MLRVVVGGPWYRTQIDTRAMVSIVALVVDAPRCGAAVVKLAGQDGLLDMSRNRLLDDAIRSGADWFLSLDADCSIVNPRTVYAALHDARRQDVALVGFPALEGSGRLNVVGLDCQRLAAPPAGQLEVSRVGFGAVAFRLGWYATHWPRDLPYCHTLPARDEHGRWGAIGEDFGHCLEVRRLKGRVLVDGRVVVQHHMSRAGSVEAQP